MRSLCDLLGSDSSDLRLAAVRVLGALRSDSPLVADALARAVAGGADARFRALALDALQAMGGAGAVEAALSLLEEENDLGRRAMELVAGAGRPILARLKQRLPSAGEAGRRHILGIAARNGSVESLDILLRALEAGHRSAVEEALSAASGPASDKDREACVARISKTLKDAKPDLLPAAFELLRRTGGPSAVSPLLERARPSHPPETRKLALETLARFDALPREATAELIPYLREGDYSHIVAPASAALEKAPIDGSNAATLLSFLRGEDPALRRFAVAALGSVDTPSSASALLEVLLGPNPDLRDRAAQSLARQKAAPSLALEALPGAKDADQVRALLHLVRPQAAKIRPQHWEPALKRAVEWLETGDARAEPLLVLLRERAGEALRTACLDRARRIKRSRRAGEMANLLRPFLREGGAELRYEAAIAELMRGRRDTSREARVGHPGLTALEALFREPEFGLLGRLKREKAVLAPEEFLLVGSHFSEKTYAERSMGEELLRWIVATFPAENAAQSAQSKLVMEGFPNPLPAPAPKAEVKPRKQPAKKARKKR